MAKKLRYIKRDYAVEKLVSHACKRMLVCDIEDMLNLGWGGYSQLDNNALTTRYNRMFESDDYEYSVVDEYPDDAFVKTILMSRRELEDTISRKLTQTQNHDVIVLEFLGLLKLGFRGLFRMTDDELLDYYRNLFCKNEPVKIELLTKEG